MKKITLSFLLISTVLLAFAQSNNEKQVNQRDEALNVYMNESEYNKVKIPYVNYVRDLEDADVYIITTTIETGSGGQAYTFYITGQNEYSNMSDTVSFFTNPDATTDEIREKTANHLQMALMRYVQKTPLADNIRIDYNGNISPIISTDKWNNWVFTPSFSFSYNDAEANNSSRTYFQLHIDKVTEDLKINMTINYQKNKNEYSNYTNTNERKQGNLVIVKSMSDHFSYGAFLSAKSNPSSNTKFQYDVTTGIEYDLYPYSEFLRRQLRIAYWVGYSSRKYENTTFWGGDERNDWIHTLSAAYNILQKWGSVNISANYTNTLDNWSNNSLDLESYMNIRVTKGLMFTVSGSYSLFKSETFSSLIGEYPGILLDKHHSTSVSCGIAYTFGSIYRNVVNPRFRNFY